MTKRNILKGGSGPPGAGAPADGPAPPAGGSDGSGADGAGFSGGGSGGEAGGSGSGRIRALPDPERDLACCRLPLTDLGNAERWRLRYGRDFRFCPEIGWYAWDGRRWALLSEEKDKIPARVMQSVFLTVRAIRNEADLIAACGGIDLYVVPERTMPILQQWAQEVQKSARERYLKGDESGDRAAWVDALDLEDMVLDFGKRKSWSVAVSAWAKTSEGSGKLKAVADLAKSFESINIEPTAMDADRMAINVLNGTLRLVRRPEKRPTSEVEAARAQAAEGGSAKKVSEWRTGAWGVRLDPHRRDDLISKLAPVKYSPRARCADYEAFIERVQPDEHMRRFIHQWGGLSLTGDIGEHKMAFFYGGGRNGKGTWVELVAHLAGDYAGSVQFESLADTGTKRRGDQATPDLAELPGIRFLRIAEPSAGVKFDDGLVKQLTGGDPVKARYLNKGFFEFLPSFKITISGNNKPNVRDTSHGFWARMQLVPWAVTIPEDEIEHRLPEKLREQASGVLNVLIAGLLDWRENGLIVPEQVRMATRTYRDQSDDLGRFLAQCCLVSDADESVRVGAKELFDVFEAWADQTGGAKWTMKGLKKALEDRGFEQKASNGMKWLRIELRPGVTVENVKAGQLPDADAPPEPEIDPDEPPPGWD